MKKELEKKDQEQFIHSFNQCISQMLQYMIHKSIADSGLSGLCAASCRSENGLGTQLPISPDPGGLPPACMRTFLSRIQYFFCYHYLLFLPEEARCVCRQAAGLGCHTDIIVSQVHRMPHIQTGLQVTVSRCVPTTDSTSQLGSNGKY
jgi:hypothetical protein